MSKELAYKLATATGYNLDPYIDSYSRMEQAMIDTWVHGKRTWQEGFCMVCGRPIDAQTVTVETLGGQMEIPVTVCDDCMPLVNEHYDSGGKRRTGDSRATETPLWDRMCPRLYREIILGDVFAENVDMDRVRRVGQWSNGPQGLILLGKSGKGKTTALWALYRELERQGINCDYWSAIELAKELSKCARDLEGATHLTRKSVLLIDDLGKERVTSASASLWWELINRRYEHRLPMIITTRYHGKEFEERMGKASAVKMGEPIIAEDIRRRLRDSCRVILFDETNEPANIGAGE